MNKQTCKNCTHFLQHYVLGEQGLVSIWCGHCIHPRLRNRKPDAPACEHFTPGIDRENDFVTREYLTRKLLQKVLDMELLPWDR